MKLFTATGRRLARALVSAAVLAAAAPPAAVDAAAPHGALGHWVVPSVPDGTVVPNVPDGTAAAAEAPLPSHPLWLDDDAGYYQSPAPQADWHGTDPAYDFGLLGDWTGWRTRFADNGITANGDLTMYYSGVADGGLRQKFRFGGHSDYVFLFDGGKMGLQEGLFVKVRAERQFADSINGYTGAAMPVNLVTNLPVADSNDLYVTNFLITQAFSEQFAVFVGKVDSLDGDANAYAHGRGKTQFSNMAMIANPVLLRTIPYSSLAAGFSVMDAGQPIFTFTAMNPTDTTSTTGINQWYEDGVTLTAEGRLPTDFLGQPGHQLVGAAWSSKTYTSLGQDPRIITGQVPIDRSSGSWALYYNFDQQLVSDAACPGRGWGLFGRAGIADDDTNPLNYFLSLGVGGSSPLRGRSQDQFGIGWYHIGASDEMGPLLTRVFGDETGVELFYNYQWNRHVSITPDVQVIEPAFRGADTVLGLGVRANIRL